MAIIKLVRSMKDKDLLGDLAVLGEILTLILGIIPLNKDLAKDSLDALKLVLESKDLEALKGLKNDLETKKKKCEGNFCPSDTK